MGKELDPGTHLQHSQWIFNSLNYTVPTDRQLYAGIPNTSSLVFPPYTNSYCCVVSANASNPRTEFQADKPFFKASALVPPLLPTYGGSQFVSPDKRFLVFDQTGGQVNLMPSSLGITSPCMNSANQSNAPGIPYMYANFGNPALNLQGNNEANGSNGNASEELHENTEEIDALLYSDSDEEYDEEASTGHSHLETVAPCSSEVASSILPTKRKRVDTDDPDASVIDTASSAVSSHPVIPLDDGNKNKHCVNDELDCVSSCIKGGNYNQNVSRKRLRRARIQETVSVLRRIIPGGRCKDTATILDEAINYLKALKVKAKSLGATPV